MKSGLNISATRLENMRQRRMNRIRRQRAIEVGKPVDVSLKSMALNSAQQKELSSLRLQPHVNLRHQSVTPSRVSVLVALGIHLIAVLLGAIFIVSPTRLDAEATIVDIVRSIPTHPRSAPQPIHDLGDDNHSLDDRLKPNPSPWGFDDRIRNIEPTRPDAFVTLEITRMPIFSKRIEPIYPSEAKRAGKEGKVVLEATIDDDGKVKDITVKEDTVGFGSARAAIQALKASRFIPAKWGEETVAQRIIVPYTFKAEYPVNPFEVGCFLPNPEPIHRDRPVSLEITRGPAFRTRIEPKYPRTAHLAQKEGQVVLTATIDVDGRAKDIKVKEDSVGFGCARAAIDALVASLFRPGERGVEIVPIRIAIPYQFKLEDEAARANRQQSRVNHRSPQTPIENDSVKIVEVGCW